MEWVTGMEMRALVEAFYSRIWNAGDLSVLPALLREDFTFRGSLGAERKGHEGFRAYVAMVRGALREYRCEVLDLVVEDRRAFARVRFSGVHEGEFLGFAPSGERVEWLGAAMFTSADDGRIADIWVLGDVPTLLEQLARNARPRSDR